MENSLSRFKTNYEDSFTCESCGSNFILNSNTPKDGDDNYFCQTCWDELAPVMREDYKAEISQAQRYLGEKMIIERLEEKGLISKGLNAALVRKNLIDLLEEFRGIVSISIEEDKAADELYKLLKK